MQRCTKKGTSNTPISNVLIYQQSRVGIAASYEFYYIPVLQFYNVLDPFCKFSLPLPWIQGQAPNCHLCTIWQLPLHTIMDNDYLQLKTSGTSLQQEYMQTSHSNFWISNSCPQSTRARVMYHVYRTKSSKSNSPIWVKLICCFCQGFIWHDSCLCLPT
jgi:hypothetical protein